MSGAPPDILRIRLSRFGLALVSLLVVASAAPIAPRVARATVLAELSIDELAERADLIVVARVRRSGPRTTVVRGRLAPVTVSVLAVRAWLKGRSAPEIAVVERGGAHGRGRTVVVGAPSYAAGESVVAFLAARPEGLATVGMAQGKFRVVDAEDPARARVVRDLRGVALLGEDATMREGAVAGGERLEAFLGRVRRAVGSAGR